MLTVRAFSVPHFSGGADAHAVIVQRITPLIIIIMRHAACAAHTRICLFGESSGCSM